MPWIDSMIPVEQMNVDSKLSYQIYCCRLAVVIQTDNRTEQTSIQLYNEDGMLKHTAYMQ